MSPSAKSEEEAEAEAERGRAFALQTLQAPITEAERRLACLPSLHLPHVPPRASLCQHVSLVPHVPHTRPTLPTRCRVQVFVPLAHRLGMWYFKTELEQRCFALTLPKEYRLLSLRLDEVCAT